MGPNVNYIDRGSGSLCVFLLWPMCVPIVTYVCCYCDLCMRKATQRQLRWYVVLHVFLGVPMCSYVCPKVFAYVSIDALVIPDLM
jgi:hypothetical protein